MDGDYRCSNGFCGEALTGGWLSSGAKKYTKVTKRGQIGRAQRSGARAQRSGNRFRGLRAGVLPRRTPRARRGQEEIVVGNWMVTTDVVMDFAVRRGWGNDDC